MPSPSRTQDVRHEPAPLERSSTDLLVSDPYVKGASFESFEAAKDALLRHTVARGLSYKVLRSDKKRSRHLVSCSLPSCPFRIRFGPNASGGVKTTVVVPHNCPPEAHLNWGRANSVKALRPRHQDRYSRDHTLRPREIMAMEQSEGNPCSYKQAWRALGAARAEAVGGEAKWVDPCRHGDVESPPPLPQELQEQVDAFRAAEPTPAPNWEDWKAQRETQREEEERQRQESERFWKQYEDDREARLGAYAREHHGIPRLQDDRGEGLELFINHLLPARDRVRLAEDSDEDGEAGSAAPEG